MIAIEAQEVEEEKYTITYIDYWEQDAVLEIGDLRVYFQFSKEPTLREAIQYLVKELDKRRKSDDL
jgi:hypothetical protein